MAAGQHSSAVLDSRRAPTRKFFSLIAAGRSVVVGEALLHVFLLRLPSIFPRHGERRESRSENDGEAIRQATKQQVCGRLIASPSSRGTKVAERLNNPGR